MDDANTTSCREVAAATHKHASVYHSKKVFTHLNQSQDPFLIWLLSSPPLAALTLRKGCSVRKKRRELPGLKNFEVTRGHKVVLVCYLTLQLSRSLEY